MDNIFKILKNNINSKKESIDLKKYKHLQESVTTSETDTHYYINNIPVAFGDTQNKNNRIYEQDSLKKAVEQYNNVKADNPYFAYIFDGHKDDDSYEFIVGKVVKMQTVEDMKMVLMNIKLNKGSKIQPLLENIIKDGDEIGVSMRIISPNSVMLTKDEISQINDDILQLEDDNEYIDKLLGANQIEYISGDSYIQRVDLTQFPSFNKAFGKKMVIKDESFNIKDIIKSSCTVNKQNICLTDTCNFRYTIRDFIDLIHKNESIVFIKNQPELYEDILSFAYFNLTDFNFNNINEKNYLEKHLYENNISKNDINDKVSNITNIVNDNIFNYIKKETLSIRKIIEKIRITFESLIKEDDNIFYHIIIVNYLHQLLNSFIIFNNLYNKKVDVISYINELESLLNNNNEFSQYIIDLINNIKNTNNLYDVLNSIFLFIYNFIDVYGDKISPMAIINESLSKLNKINIKKKIFKAKYINRK